MASADIHEIRGKSKKMGDLFIAAVEQNCHDYGFDIVSPRQADQRGSQISLSHEYGYPIIQALIEKGVIGDFRAPDVMRFGLTPLYLRYEDVYHAVRGLQEVMDTEAWRRPEYAQRLAVT